MSIVAYHISGFSLRKTGDFFSDISPAVRAGIASVIYTASCQNLINKMRTVNSLCQRVTAPDIGIPQKLVGKTDNTFTGSVLNFIYGIGGICKGFVIFRLDQKLGHGHVFFSCLGNVAKCFLALLQISAFYKTAHIPGFDVYPFFVAVSYDVAQSIGRQLSDDSGVFVCFFAYMQIIGYLCVGIYLIDLCKALSHIYCIKEIFSVIDMVQPGSIQNRSIFGGFFFRLLRVCVSSFTVF